MNLKRLIPSNLKDVYYSYDNSDVYALNNISFTVKKGEYLGIVGLSGSGKSTFTFIIDGHIAPYKRQHLY